MSSDVDTAPPTAAPPGGTKPARRWLAVLQRRESGMSSVRDSFERTWFWWIVVVVAAFAYPLYAGSDYVYFEAGQVAIYAIVGIGMNILYGLGGQASLGQGAVVGAGAYTTGALSVHYGWSLWLAAVAAIFVGALVGMVMGLPALRLSTWYFALSTLAFSNVVIGLIHHFGSVTGGSSGLVGIPVLASPQNLYWIILAVTAVGLVIFGTFANSRLGRGLVAIKAGGEAGAVSGVPSARLKLIAFGISGAYAGVGGALFAAEQQVLTPDLFTLIFSIFFIVILVAGGVGRWLGPVIGALAFFAVPELLTSLASWRIVIYGGALLAFMAFAPHGLMGAAEDVYNWLESRVRRRGEPKQAPAPERAPQPVEHLPTVLTRTPDEVAGDEAGPGRLVVDDVTVAFGGLRALDGVSMTIESGVVHGLVGPNGSGKTTLLNVITGIYVPTSGRVALRGHLLTGTPPWRMAKLGVARTFQTPRLLQELTVWENVMLGGYSVERATALEVVLRLPRARRDARHLSRYAHALLDALGLADRAGVRAADLPHGQQRMVEIARALMVEPVLLLLDEPAAGLSQEELVVLDTLVRDLQKSGMTVLIVEHHIGWVREVCESVTVLDQGKIVTSGTPQAAFDDPRVRETYLGVLG